MSPNELPQESKLLATDLLSAVATCFRHNRSMPEKKAERKCFVATIFNSLAATPARLRSPDCPPPTVTAPGALPAAGPLPFHSATTQIALSTGASAPARIPARHRPRCGSRSRAGCGTQTGRPRKDRPGVSPGTTEPEDRSPSFHPLPRPLPGYESAG